MERVREEKEAMHISYMLKENKDFFEVGYKVMQNQSLGCFVEGYKVLRNGQIRIVYDTGKYSNFEKLLLNSKEETFFKLVVALLKSIKDIKEIGFIEYENIVVNFENIFVDENTLKIKYVYIPLKKNSNSGEGEFLEAIKIELINMVKKNSNIKYVLDDLTNIIEKNNDIKEWVNEISLLERNIISRNVIKEKLKKQDKGQAQKSVKVEKPKEQEVKRESKETKKESKKLLGWLFKKNKNSIEEEINKDNYKGNLSENHIEEVEAEEGTCILTENKKVMALIAINTEENFEMIVNKKEFVIGSSKDMADGYIHFNKAISRRHCKICDATSNYNVEDLGSSNGTFVNGQVVMKGDKKEIKDGDILKIANLEFLFRTV